MVGKGRRGGVDGKWTVLGRRGSEGGDLVRSVEGIRRSSDDSVGVESRFGREGRCSRGGRRSRTSRSSEVRSDDRPSSS